MYIYTHTHTFSFPFLSLSLHFCLIFIPIMSTMSLKFLLVQNWSDYLKGNFKIYLLFKKLYFVRASLVNSYICFKCAIL